MNSKLEIKITNKINEVSRVVEQVEVFAEEINLPFKVLNTVNLALDEIITNIISYGYADEESHEIKIELFLHDGVLSVIVEDDAKAFNPLDQPEPDIDIPLEEKQIGGLGIHLIKNLMDELDYTRAGNKNIFVMRKKI